MCCHSHRGRRDSRKTAYGKYQEHKAEKRAIAFGTSPNSNHRQISQEQLPEVANDEVLERTGINPPSYDELVTSRAIAPAIESYVFVNGKEIEVTERDDLSDAGSFSDDAGFVERWKAQRELKRTTREQEKVACRSKREEKKAGRAASLLDFLYWV